MNKNSSKLLTKNYYVLETWMAPVAFLIVFIFNCFFTPNFASWFLIIFRKSSAFDETVKKRSSSSYAPVVSMTSSGRIRMEVRQMRTLINVTIKPV